MENAESEQRLEQLKTWIDERPEADNSDTLRAGLEELIGLNPTPYPKYRLRLARLYIRSGALGEAEALAQDVAEKFPNNPRAQAVLADLDWARFDITSALARYRALALENPDTPLFANRFIAMATEVSGPLVVSEFLRTLKAAGGDISKYFRAAFFHRLGDPNVLASAVEPIRNGARVAAREVLNIFADMGPQSGERILQALASSKSGDNRTEAADIADILADFPKDEELLRPAIHEDISEAIAWAPEPDRETSVDPEAICLVFSGGAQSFGVPACFLDRYLAKRGLAALYLRDPRRLVGHAGLPGLGTDFRSAALSLKQQVEARGYKKIYVMGFSLGGFWGFSYGLVMQAEAMAGFGAMTYLDKATMTARKEPRAPHYAHQLWESVGQDGLDLPGEMERADRVPPTHIFYGADHRYDADHADALAHLENVTLHGFTGLAGHAISVELKRLGQFDKALDTFLPAFKTTGA